MDKIHESRAKLHELSFSLVRLSARLLTCSTAAFAALSAFYGLFGDLSDLSAGSIAAGPHGTQLGIAGQQVITLRTVSGWAHAEPARQARAASEANSSPASAASAGKWANPLR